MKSKANDVTRDPLTGVQVRFGVMGSAGGAADRALLDRCQKLGQSIARQGCCLLTGACPGLPHQAVLGARDVGGHTIGISPAVSLKEHVDVYGSPFKEYDVLIFTGLGLMGRELVNIRSSDIVVVVGGRSGTLGEFAIAYEEGKLIGVLAESGGITSALPGIVDSLGAEKSTGADVLYDAEPERLIERLLKRYLSGSYVCPCYPDDSTQPGSAKGGVDGRRSWTG
jgi:uncharacterized protein (TIGR00725 family)